MKSTLPTKQPSSTTLVVPAPRKSFNPTPVTHSRPGKEASKESSSKVKRQGGNGKAEVRDSEDICPASPCLEPHTIADPILSLQIKGESGQETLSMKGPADRASVSSKQPLTTRTMDSNEDPGQSRPQFCAFGVEAYPTHALKNEICIDFIHPKRWCDYGYRCNRIHPLNTRFYLEKLLIGESGELFCRDAKAQPSQPTPLPSTLNPPPPFHNIATKPLQPTPVSTAQGNRQCPVTELAAPPPHPTKRRIFQPPKREPGWDPETGQWDFASQSEQWYQENDSSSEDGRRVVPRPPIYPSSSRSSETEDDSKNPKGRHSRVPEICRTWLRGQSRSSSPCRSAHDDISQQLHTHQGRVSAVIKIQPLAPHVAGQSALNLDTRPRLSAVCRDWLRGSCLRGTGCPYQHSDVRSNDAKIQAQAQSPEKRAEIIPKLGPTRNMPRLPPRPPSDEICRKWLRNECQRGHACLFVHRDLEYDTSVPPRQPIKVPDRKPVEIMATLIYKHIKIRVADGFDITQVVTGFETSWIYVSNVPRRTKQDEVSSLLKAHGELIDLRMPPPSSAAFTVVKARFISAVEAAKACTTLNGLEVFGTTVTARLSLHNSGRGTLLNDTSVRISWEAPCRTAYGGFPTEERAFKAIEKCRGTPLGNHLLKAQTHNGLPAVGRFNVRFQGVPVDIDLQGMKLFVDADDIMWSPPNYASHQSAVNGIKRMLHSKDADVLEFEIMPAPYKYGTVVGWAHFPTSAEAKAACERMQGRKPAFTGHTRIYAHHMQTLEYSLTNDKFGKVLKDLQALQASAWRMGNLSVTLQERPTSVSVRLCGEDLKELSRLKAELDVVLSGEILRENGKVVWDRFFAMDGGVTFVKNVEREHAPSTVGVDMIRKTIRLFGSSSERMRLRNTIMAKVKALRMQKTSTIPLDGHTIGLFMNDELKALSKELGEDNVFLDLWNRCLTIRGDEHAYNAARDAVNRARRNQRSTPRFTSGVQCPVCFDEVSSPVTLCCGHSWCRTCLIRYMMTAIDQKFFPLTCLGNDAKCEEKITLSCARQILPAADFEALTEAAFSSHIQRHSDEFAYCPTPDCQQIYRPMPRVQVPQPSSSRTSTSKPSTSASSSTVSAATILQCPSCLLRICASCQTEAHDGLMCVRPDEGDSLFEEWMKNNDVKPCPGCKMPIEKVMGCHHVTCTVCSTHLCWICLTPFPNGAGVYGHMLAVHGSFV